VSLSIDTALKISIANKNTIAFERTRQQLYNKFILMYETALANPVAYLKLKCKWFDKNILYFNTP